MSNLPNGVSAHDTFNRVSQIIDCESLRGFLTNHGRDILDVLAEKQICLDGKKLRGRSPSSRGNKGLYIVNAWVSENRLCIGQQMVHDKSNEIGAIPELLREMDLTEAVVTVDAIGCQKSIARQISGQKGHWAALRPKDEASATMTCSCKRGFAERVFHACIQVYARCPGWKVGNSVKNCSFSPIFALLL